MPSPSPTPYSTPTPSPTPTAANEFAAAIAPVVQGDGSISVRVSSVFKGTAAFDYTTRTGKDCRTAHIFVIVH